MYRCKSFNPRGFEFENLDTTRLKPDVIEVTTETGLSANEETRLYFRVPSFAQVTAGNHDGKRETSIAWRSLPLLWALKKAQRTRANRWIGQGPLAL
jgi:hypothetical protein